MEREVAITEGRAVTHTYRATRRVDGEAKGVGGEA